MDLAELRSALAAEGIDPRSYSVDSARSDETYVLERNGNVWDVYYFERGLRSGLRSFETEEQAARQLFSLLVGDDGAHLA